MVATPTACTSEFSITFWPCYARKYPSKSATARKYVLAVHLKEVVTSTIQSTIFVLYSLLILCFERGDGFTASHTRRFRWISWYSFKSKSSYFSGVVRSVLFLLWDLFPASIDAPRILLTLIGYLSWWFWLFKPLRWEAVPDIDYSGWMFFMNMAFDSRHSSRATFSVPWDCN